VLSPGPAPIQDDPNLDGYSVPERVAMFVKRAMRDANVTLGNHIMWTMGDDFNYMDAQMWYKNLDKLIKAVNADGRVEAFYSTPYEYTLAKLTDANVTYPPLQGDFFPYRIETHAFLTGFYTSRPALRYVRLISGYWSISRQIRVAGAVFDAAVPLSYLAEALALAQHHDGITGTAKQHVAFDYAKRIYNGTR
jgi:alpha-mannosidase